MRLHVNSIFTLIVLITLWMVKPYLNRVAEEISSVLGVDYTALAKEQ